MMGVRSYKNLASELDRGVWHVSIHLTDTSNETHQGAPDGTQGYLTACYRSIIDTIAFTFFEAESGIRSKIESKTRKSRMDRIENLSAKKRKKSTYLVPRVVFRLGLIDVVQRLHKLRTYLYRNNIAVDIQFNLFHHASLLCANFVPTSISPTLYGLLYSVTFQFSTKRPMTLGPKIQQKKKAWLHVHDDFCRLGVAPKMKSGRPIISFFNQLLQ